MAIQSVLLSVAQPSMRKLGSAISILSIFDEALAGTEGLEE